MYNESLKNNFINMYTKSDNTAAFIRSMFNSTERYESFYNKDFCELSIHELQPMIDKILGIRLKSKLADIHAMREYVSWCIAMDVPGACKDIFNVNLLGIDKLKSQMVSSPMHLQKCLDGVFDPEDYGTVDIVYRCFLWMGYSGIKDFESVDIRENDVDLSRLRIKYNGVNFPIYRESIAAFKNAVNLTQFSYIHPNYSKTIFRDRVSGDLILRGVKADSSILTLRAVLSRKLSSAVKNGDSSNQLSYNRLRMSGEFYRVYENERAGVSPDFTPFAKSMMSMEDGIDERELKRKQDRKAREYMEDYRRWKLAFSN